MPRFILAYKPVIIALRSNSIRIEERTVPNQIYFLWIICHNTKLKHNQVFHVSLLIITQFVPFLASTKLGESEQPTSAWSLTGENTISSPPQLNIKALRSLEKGILLWTKETIMQYGLPLPTKN